MCCVDMHLYSVFNGISVLQCFKCVDVIEMCNGIIFDFYSGTAIYQFQYKYESAVAFVTKTKTSDLRQARLFLLFTEECCRYN